MKIRFTLNSKGVKHNLHEFIFAGKLSNDQLVDAVSYQSELSRWWQYKYNTDQPVEVVRFMLQ